MLGVSAGLAMGQSPAGADYTTRYVKQLSKNPSRQA